MEVLFYQYALICETREALFSYCESISYAHLVQDLDVFGGRSIRSMMVHVANTYHYWIGHFAGIDLAPFAKAEAYQDVQKIRTLFRDVDAEVDAFLKKFHQSINEPIVNTVPMREFQLALTPLQLYTQVMTHEYHHKGQILSMSRLMGYTPVDTDVIRFA